MTAGRGWFRVGGGRRLLAVALSVASLLTVVPSYAAAGAPSAGPTRAVGDGATAGAGRGVPRTAGTVTLITGDVVRLDPEGEPSVAPAAGRDGTAPVRPRAVSYARYQRDGAWYVVPTDAVPLLRADLLDERLFDVTGLLAQGYDDNASPVLPLLVQYADPGQARRAVPLAGTGARRVLPGLNLTANDQPKATGARFWADLVRQANPAARSIRGGVRKVWLNARYRASLHRSVPQIGAPTAWQAGYTGRGVTVAVLDSGYDTDHPDLAGRVSAAQDFTGTGSVEDRFGHGTHVAATVGGSGAAGRHRGVAPDAKLAVGKVLDDSGDGSEEWILAGMEWAATKAGAKVVNLSLGGGPSDGTDPVSQAVDRLSAEHGTLFVAAAGNRGAYAPVSAPASADAALAVSSVDPADRISEFSSRGPRVGDGAPKPELAAPGEAILAARATGAYPGIAGHPDHVPLSGTSMAAPHVAGAAAILAQRHPEWTGAQLKAALVGAAAPARESRVFDVGAGRIDVARAVTQPVRAEVASLAMDLPWGAPGGTRQLTYRNDGSTPVTLRLALSLADTAGQPAPPQLATLGATTLTVPARGSAAVPVRIAGRQRAGTYGGVVVATAGETSVRTPVGVRQAAETHEVTVRLLDQQGRPSDSGTTMVVGIDAQNAGFRDFVWGSGSVSVPAGRYALLSSVYLPPPPNGGLRTAVLGYPGLTLADDTTVTLDARWARAVPLGVADQPAATEGLREIVIGGRWFGDPTNTGMGNIVEPGFGEVLVGSAPGVSAEEFSLTDMAVLERPMLQLSATAPERFPVRVGWLWKPGPTPPFEGTARLPVVRLVVGPTGELPDVDVADALAVLTSANDEAEPFALAPVVRQLQQRGARMVLLATGQFGWAGDPLALPTISSGPGYPGIDRFVELAGAGTLTATVTGQPVSPYRYQLGYQVRGGIPADLAYRPTTGELAAVLTSYHDAGEGVRQVRASLRLGDEYHGLFASSPVFAPLRRTEYYTPGSWRISLGNDIFPAVARTELRLRPGANPATSWDKAVVGPALTGPTVDNVGKPWVSRQGDVVDVMLPMFSDSSGHPRPVDAFDDGTTGSTSLYRNGQLLGTVAEPGRGQFAVPAAAATYRLTASATHHSPTWRSSTTVSGSWTFRSATASGRLPLPLLGMLLDAPVDLRNTVSVGDRRPVRMSVHRQDGVAGRPVVTVTVAASYDDGRSWHAVPVSRDGEGWLALVPHRRAGHVSLRANATDADGNAVEQTVLRAYRVGG
ncbi:S8 family serine peptidase [Micromonospora sp. NPDC048905]|uniref:S8 family serine peptidase n=1 Tax=Micromonospora sp. NPDC048905 TaxID=3155494 RepID=UPI0033C56D6F